MIAAIDTNAYTAFCKGDERVRRQLARVDEVVISAVAAGELIYGFRYGSRTERNLDEFAAFLANPHVRLLKVGYTTADRFGRLAADLRRAGTPIPTNDIWIAAHALEAGAYLLSFDRHFGCVPGLAWIDIAP